MTHYAVTAFGADRPGIVAALTGALSDAGANLEDVSSTILRGHFAMMLVVEGPHDPEGLQSRLAAAVEPLGVSVTARPLAEAGQPPTVHEPATHGLSVYGRDRPGIVAGVARVLASRGVNVTDLSCRLVVDGASRIYSLVAEVTVPGDVDAAALESELREVTGRLGVDMSFQRIEPEVL